MATAERRFARCISALVIGLVAALSATAPAASQPPGWAVWDLAPGVHHLLTERPGLVAHAAVVDAGSSFAIRPVVAFDRVGGGHGANDGRQPVTDLCARAGGIVCVNGDFFNCKWCGQVAGGIVDRGRALRSFRPDHEQASIIGGVPTLDPLTWVGSIHGSVGRDSFNLSLASLNRGPLPGGAVLYTPDWGPTTPQVPGQVEIVFAAGGPYVPGVRALVPVSRRPVSGAIPRDGVVIAANGRAAEKLNWLWDAWRGKANRARHLVLDSALSAPADLNVGGHPVLLRNRERQPLDGNDTMVTRRHPRTVLGWTASGDLLLVTIDGRQPGYSDGATLSEATDLMTELGAVDAINLDGGGSSTFALRCDTGACVANRPSDGRQRPVALALAVVPAAPRPAAPVHAAAVGAKATAIAAAIAAPPTTVPAPTTTVAPATTVPEPVAAPLRLEPVPATVPDAELVAAPFTSGPAGSGATEDDDLRYAAIAATAILAWAVVASRRLPRSRAR
jgi:hypothetical protein